MQYSRRFCRSLCHPRKHNFFADLAAGLPADYKSDAQSQQDAEIAELRMKVAWLEGLVGK